jgi:large subunit ribosomal protein L17
MRHRKKGKILGRKIGPRRALLKSLAVNFLLKEKIKTTEAKAKAIKPIVEKLITRAKKNNLANYREINSFLQNRTATKKLLEEIAPRYKERSGGYCRLIKLGPRKGDAAEMVILELV